MYLSSKLPKLVSSDKKSGGNVYIRRIYDRLIYNVNFVQKHFLPLPNQLRKNMVCFFIQIPINKSSESSTVGKWVVIDYF